MTELGSETKWYTVAEACEILKVSENTLRKMIANEEIPAKRFGPKLLRIPAKAIDEFEGVES